MKRCVLFGMMIVLGAGVACGAARMDESRSVSEQYLFASANAERTQRGLPALRWDEALHKAAQAHAREMASRRSISHQYPGELDLSERGHAVGARFSRIAENVAEAPSAVRVHDAWMKSEGHRENLLDPVVDSVGISVIVRDGQLYAVEDFDRSVRDLTLDDQEHAVEGLLRNVADVDVLTGSEEARETCTMSTGFAGERRPMFVMRFTATDLSKLPEALKTRLGTGKYHQAAVGACPTKGQESFSTFSIAVMLYP